MANRMKFVNFNVPRTKTKAEGDTINLSDSACNCSAINAFEHYLSSNMDIPPDAPLFAFETVEKSWSPMKCMWFFNRCNEIWCKEGLSSVKGHSFHIGGTTHLLLLGSTLG